MMGETEARIRRLQARLQNLEFRTGNVQDKILRDRQALGMFRQASWNTGFAATVSGQVNGCSSHGYDGAQVAIKDHASGVTLATFTANSSGVYSGSLLLTTSPQTVDVVATPTGPNAAAFATSATLSSFSLSSGSHAITTITIPPAIGFVCVCGCVVPMPTTASFGDNQGTHTLTWTPGPFPGYTASVVIPGQALFTRTTGSNCGGPVTGNLTISYNLQCITSPNVWRLTVSFGAILCSGTPDTLQYQSPAVNSSVSGDVSFVCNPAMLAFTLPTGFTGAAPAPLPVPGGGGSITVVF